MPQRQVVGRRREDGGGEGRGVPWGRWARRAERGGGGIEAGGKSSGVRLVVVVVVAVVAVGFRLGFGLAVGLARGGGG